MSSDDPDLTRAEQALAVLRRAEQEILNGLAVDYEAGLEDVRERARRGTKQRWPRWALALGRRLGNSATPSQRAASARPKRDRCQGSSTFAAVVAPAATVTAVLTVAAGLIVADQAATTRPALSVPSAASSAAEPSGPEQTPLRPVERPAPSLSAEQKVTLSATALFGATGARLLHPAAARAELKPLAARARATSATIELIEVTDANRESDGTSALLSLERAQVITDVLVRLGAPRDQIVVEVGTDEPGVPTVTQEGPSAPIVQPAPDPDNRAVVMLVS